MYLNHDIVGKGNASVVLRSLYEAQNPTLFPHYYTDCGERRFLIGSQEDIDPDLYPEIFGPDPDPHTPYDCYALSYCLSHSSDQLCYFLSFGFNNDNDIPLVETFVKGLNDHCLTTTPRVKHLEIEESSPSLVDRGLPWLMRANFLATVEEIVLHTTIINNSYAQTFLSSLVNLQSFYIHETIFISPIPITSWKWLAGLKSLSELRVLHISSSEECSPPPTDIHSWLGHGLIEGNNKLTEVVLDIKFPSNTIYDFHSPTDVLVDSVLKSVLRANQITKMVLPNISRETMAGVRDILLHCPSLTTLDLKRTRLGYDEILYICSALKNNTTLRHLVIHDDLQLPQSSDEALSRDDAIVSSKTTCTDLLLELSKIVKDNTLEEMNIQSDCAGGNDEEMIFELKKQNINSDVAHGVLETLAKCQLLKNVEYCEWLASPESLKQLQELCITNKSLPTYSEVNVLDIEFPTTPDICNALNQTVDLIVHTLVIRLNTFSEVTLSNISRETMAGVHSILLNCPSLITLELYDTRLGYDGILYICSALQNNTTLTHLVIHDDLQLPPSRKIREWGDIQFTSFSSMERVPLPGKTTCTDFLLELNNILKDNTTLKEMKIQSGLFLPLSAGEDGNYCQWTGLGPLQQFNVGAVGSGMSPNLRRSFSSSDLTQPQSTLFWDRRFDSVCWQNEEVDFKALFSEREEEGKKLFSLFSFTAPDTDVLQSFSGLDPRLKECLEISHLHQNVKRLRETYWGMMVELYYNPRLSE